MPRRDCSMSVLCRCCVRAVATPPCALLQHDAHALCHTCHSEAASPTHTHTLAASSTCGHTCGANVAMRSCLLAANVLGVNRCPRLQLAQVDFPPALASAPRPRQQARVSRSPVLRAVVGKCRFGAAAVWCCGVLLAKPSCAVRPSHSTNRCSVARPCHHDVSTAFRAPLSGVTRVHSQARH